MDDYMCALKKKVLLQGRLFVFERHFCFYSSLFGYHKAKVIPLEAVVDISKKKNVGFPNSIQVIWNAGGNAGVKKEFFASFLSREDAYRLMLGLWARCSERGRERAALELAPTSDTSDNEGGDRANHRVSVEHIVEGGHQSTRALSKRWSKWGKSDTHEPTTTAASSSTARHRGGGVNSSGEASDDDGTLTPRHGVVAGDARGSKDRLPWMGGAMSPLPTRLEAHNALSDNDNDDANDNTSSSLNRASIVPGTGTGNGTNNTDGNTAILREFEDGPTCDDASVVEEFKTATEPAPPPPENMQRVLVCSLPTTPLGFYRTFLCPSSDFFVAFHESQGHHSIQISPWQRHYKVGPVRDLRFVTPLKGWRIGPPQALCHQTQRFKVHSGQHLLFETSQVMSDIPYGDHFRVDQRWDVTPGPDSRSCTLTVHIAVPFTKSTMWKKVIEKSVTESTLEAFRMFKELANRKLESFKEMHPGSNSIGGGGGASNGINGGVGRAAGGVANSSPVATTPFGNYHHRRMPSRPSSPEEALPTSNEEWEALMAQVEPQWRGGLRALRRMQLATSQQGGGGSNGGGGGGGTTTSTSPLPGGPRHRRRGSRASRGGSGAFEFQNISRELGNGGDSGGAMHLQFGGGGGVGGVNTSNGGIGGGFMSFPSSPRLPCVFEGHSMLGEDASFTARAAAMASCFLSKLTNFASKKGPVLLLCLLCFIIVCLQMSLLAFQLGYDPLNVFNGGFSRASVAGRQAAQLFSSDGATPETIAREVASLTTDLQSLQKEARTWAAQADTAVRAASGLADRIKRLQVALK
jgi:VAD1 Analog of StAR-related lipid transfer domain/GRAM domain